MNKTLKLKQKRKERGFTTDYMATQLNKSIHTYRSYEQEVRKPRQETLKQISKILKCKVDELI